MKYESNNRLMHTARRDKIIADAIKNTGHELNLAVVSEFPSALSGFALRLMDFCDGGYEANILTSTCSIPYKTAAASSELLTLRQKA